jgi:hypothetical protein
MVAATLPARSARGSVRPLEQRELLPQQRGAARAAGVAEALEALGEAEQGGKRELVGAVGTQAPR